MKQNLISSNSNHIIKTKNDYNKAIKNKEGIYRYTNLNDTTIFYNKNIKRLVQNYRYGFINLAQANIINDRSYDEQEIELLLDLMNKYFPTENFPLEVSQNLLLAETIYQPIEDEQNYKKIIYNLAKNDLSDNNIAIELKIEILRILARIDGNSELFISSIENFFNNHDLTVEHEMYLSTFLYQTLTLEEFKYLCDNILDVFLGVESEIVLLQSIVESNNSPFIEHSIERIFSKFFNSNNQFNFELQKYTGDIISKVLTISELKNICENIFAKYKSVGLLYTLTFALEENNISTYKVLEITNKWLIDFPNNEELMRLNQYLLQNNQFQ
jgi:hypothetical protein